MAKPQAHLVIDPKALFCSDEHMRVNRLGNALTTLSAAITEAQEALEEAQAEPDPLAAHIFVSRRQLRHLPEVKSGKRSQTAIRLTWQTACELGFRGTLDEWERLMGATSNYRR